MKKTRRFLSLFLMLAFSLSLLVGEAGAALKAAGPTSTVTTLPTWYQDLNNLALEPCLDQNGMCVLTPPFDPAITNPPDPITTTGPINNLNFPDESFYFIADSTLDNVADSTTPGVPGRAVLRLAMESAFLGGVFPGGGGVFLRINLKQMSGLTPNSTYTVIHPYGSFDFQTDAAGTASAVGGAAYRAEDPLVPATFGNYFPPELATAPNTNIGPFLRRAAGLIFDNVSGHTYIGDPAAAVTVTGSPTGNNFFRITGPGIAFGGGNTVQTTLFNIAGRVFTGAIASPLTVDRASYARNTTTTQIDVFATTSPFSNLGTPSVLRVTVGADNTTMAMDTAGNGFAHIVMPNPSPFPLNVTVTNISDNVTGPAKLTVPLVDEVVLSQASWNPADNTMRIKAASRDTLVPPTLTTADFGNLTAGSLVVPNVNVPPASITVVSSKGGGDTEWVRVGPPTAHAASGLDFDGDGKADIAVYRSGSWFIIRSSDGGVFQTDWGIAGDVVVPGDYDGDGMTDVAVYRPSAGMWFIVQSSNGAVIQRNWGITGDIPSPADYDGDGKTDLAVWRPSSGVWFIIRSSDGQIVQTSWGINGDIPLQ